MRAKHGAACGDATVRVRRGEPDRARHGRPDDPAGPGSRPRVLSGLVQDGCVPWWCSRLAGGRALGGSLGPTANLAWMPVFSSTESTSTVSVESTYQLQMSPARCSNSSREESVVAPRSVRCGLMSARADHLRLGSTTSPASHQPPQGAPRSTDRRRLATLNPRANRGGSGARRLKERQGAAYTCPARTRAEERQPCRRWSSTA